MNSLKDIFNKLKNSSYNGVKGVFVVDTGYDGPCVGITVCTHGNEPCGLSVVEKFMKGDVHLLNGKVIFVLNNIQATENYFNAVNDEQKRKCRFVDVNMNRLPDDLSGEEYEVKRAKELLPIWSEFDYALDIHSTAQPSEAMIVEGTGDASSVTKNMPVNLIVRNIVQTQVGTPAIGFYGENCISIGLEAGSHEDNKAAVVAENVVLNLLSQLRMIECPKGIHFYKQNILNVHSSLIFPNESYELVKVFPMFCSVKKGEVLAKGNGGDITSPIDGMIILAPKAIRPLNIKEEVLFICTVDGFY